MKKGEFSAKSCGFLGRNNSENKIKKRTKKMTKLSSLGQEPTFKEQFDAFQNHDPSTFCQLYNSVYVH